MLGLVIEPASRTVWLELGRSLVGANNASANSCLRRAAVLTPTDPEPNVLLAKLACSDRSYDTCLRLLYRAVITAPELTIVYRASVEVLQSVPDANDFMTFCSRWRCLDPIDPSAVLFLGFAAEKRGFPEAARQHYAEAVCLAPHRLDAILSLADEFFLDNVEFAGDWYERAMILDPDSAQAKTNFSIYLQALDELPHASKLANKAVLLRPDLCEAVLNLGSVEVEWGNANRAVELLFRAARIDPSSTAVKSNLGFLLLFTGRFGEGWRWHEWRSLAPDETRINPSIVNLERILSGIVVVR
jgi:Flp pilus assembly protein TadD